MTASPAALGTKALSQIPSLSGPRVPVNSDDTPLLLGYVGAHVVQGPLLTLPPHTQAFSSGNLTRGNPRTWDELRGEAGFQDAWYPQKALASQDQLQLQVSTPNTPPAHPSTAKPLFIWKPRQTRPWVLAAGCLCVALMASLLPCRRTWSNLHLHKRTGQPKRKRWLRR
jgi:hypothetical protein